MRFVERIKNVESLFVYYIQMRHEDHTFTRAASLLAQGYAATLGSARNRVMFCHNLPEWLL